MKVEEVVQLTPLIRRVTASNASVFTGPGTNTYLIGKEEVTVLDPGPAIHTHIEAILKASMKIKQIVVTHTHPDHSPGTKLLQKELDIPAYGMITETPKGQDTSFHPARILSDGEILIEDSYSLEVIHTPGHASNHLCYLLKEEGIIFTGDHVMQGSTVVIVPPDGHMQSYINSLSKLKDYPLEKIAPGHGELMSNPHEVVDWIILHRLERQKKVIESLERDGSGNPDSLVSSVYSDVDTSLHPIAKWSLESHLIKLHEEGLVTKEDSKYTLV